MTVNYSLTIQTFSKLIEEDRIYVDKTDLIYDLVRKGSGQAYFFSRIDAVVETKECIYIFEFKKNQQPEIAIQQILDRKYPEKYALSQKEIQLIGVSFSLRKRGIDKWKQVLYETKHIHN